MAAQQIWHEDGVPVVSVSLVKAKCKMYLATAAQTPLAVAESGGGAKCGILNLTLLQSSLPP